MPTEKEVLNAFVSKTLNMDESGVASLYNEDESLKDDALETLSNKFAEKIQSLKPDTKKFFDDGYKKGQKESLSNFEKEAKAKFGLQSDKQGIELLEDLVLQYQKDHPEDPDKIKKSKFYIDAVSEFNKKLSETEAEYNKRLETFQKTVEREKLFGNVSNQALIIFENLKPILPEDAAKAANLKGVFIKELEGLEYTIREGEIILLDKEGNDLADKYSNRIKFEDVVKQTAEKYFDFYKAEGKTSPTHTQNSKTTSTVFNITSEQQYLTLRKTVKPEDLAALTSAFQKFNQGK